MMGCSAGTKMTVSGSTATSTAIPMSWTSRPTGGGSGVTGVSWRGSREHANVSGPGRSTKRILNAMLNNKCKMALRHLRHHQIEGWVKSKTFFVL